MPTVSVVEDLRSTFTGITKDVVGVLSVSVIMGILIIVLPVLLQMQKLIGSLTGMGTATQKATTTAITGVQGQTTTPTVTWVMK